MTSLTLTYTSPLRSEKVAHGETRAKESKLYQVSSRHSNWGLTTSNYLNESFLKVMTSDYLSTPHVGGTVFGEKEINH